MVGCTTTTKVTEFDSKENQMHAFKWRTYCNDSTPHWTSDTISKMAKNLYIGHTVTNNDVISGKTHPISLSLRINVRISPLVSLQSQIHIRTYVRMFYVVAKSTYVYT